MRLPIVLFVTLLPACEATVSGDGGGPNTAFSHDTMRTLIGGVNDQPTDLWGYDVDLDAEVYNSFSLELYADDLEHARQDQETLDLEVSVSYHDPAARFASAATIWAYVVLRGEFASLEPDESKRDQLSASVRLNRNAYGEFAGVEFLALLDGERVDSVQVQFYDRPQDLMPADPADPGSYYGFDLRFSFAAPSSQTSD
jgi:hypothetical protein